MVIEVKNVCTQCGCDVRMLCAKCRDGRCPNPECGMRPRRGSWRVESDGTLTEIEQTPYQPDPLPDPRTYGTKSAVVRP